jgi:hypothetical protein
MKKKKIIIISTGIIILLAVFVAGMAFSRDKGTPFLIKQDKFMIGIYEGNDPFNLEPAAQAENPVLQAKDVTDIDAVFIADPFMIQGDDNRWYMFFEVMNADTWQGDIGMASSDDGYHWQYEKIVLNEHFHMSYPYVFKWEDEYYMIPESMNAYSVRLYKAKKFPDEWEFVDNIIYGDLTDPCIVRYNDKWWIFATGGIDANVFRLYYADNLEGPWTEHAQSPLQFAFHNATLAREGGRIIEYNNQLYRFAQNNIAGYGNSVRAFAIDTLTTTEYKEHLLKEDPIIRGDGEGWNANGMHNLDPHQVGENKWLAVVDGYKKGFLFGHKY